jgi:DNA-binding XRE family transcriptional regulator
VAEPPVTFAGVLRKLRTEAGLTQEELAEAAGVSLRSVSDLERGRVTIPQKDTVRLLADALHLIGPARARFEATARGRAVADSAAATRTLPHDIASFTCGCRKPCHPLRPGRTRGSGQAVCLAFEVHQQVAGLLGHPLPGRMRGDPGQAHAPGASLGVLTWRWSTAT